VAPLPLNVKADQRAASRNPRIFASTLSNSSAHGGGKAGRRRPRPHRL